MVYLQTKTLRYLECSFFHLLFTFLGVMKGLSLYVEGRRSSFLFARPRPREIFHKKGSVLGRHNRNLSLSPSHLGLFLWHGRRNCGRRRGAIPTANRNRKFTKIRSTNYTAGIVSILRL